MTVDFDIKTYFTPNLTPGFGATIGWKRPWELAYLNLGVAGDTVPGVHQYVFDDRWEDGLRAPIESIQITKTLDQGSWAHIEMVTHSDRDIFEIVDNEGTGHMLPRMKFPYRAWEIDLKSKADSSWHTPALFRGMLTDVAIQNVSDVIIANQQDGVWRIGLDLQSFDAFNLHKDIGAPLWFHRANTTTNDYHWGFTPQDSITFAQMITWVVEWMNVGRPTTDFPITYSFASGSSPYNATPYTDSIFDPIPLSIFYIDGTGTHADAITFTNGSTAVEGSANSQFTDFLEPGMLIAPDANIVGADRLTAANWGKISSITDDNTLVLTANYGGTTRNTAASSRNGNTVPIITCKDTSTWDILRQILQHMGVRQGLGYTYLPQVSTTGAITAVRGGYDKAHAVDEDFRSTYGMQYDTATDLYAAAPINTNKSFNMIRVPFSGMNDNEYWIKFLLKKNTVTILNIPSNASNYEYVPYDANNIHSSKYYKIPTQKAVSGDTYEWEATLVSATTALTGTLTFTNASTSVTGSGTIFLTELKAGQSIKLNVDGVYHSIASITNNTTLVLNSEYSEAGGAGASTRGTIIATTGGLAYSPADYNFLNSPSKIKYGDLKTFIMTMGKCSQVGIYNATTALNGCKDGGLNSKCPNRQGCYPDPLATPAESVNAKYGILGSSGDYAYTSNENAWDTMCRQHSQTLYECFQNTDSSIREPYECAIKFNDGWMTDLVGSYLEIYSPELDEMVMIRCIEQSHALSGNRVSTIMRGFRV